MKANSWEKLSLTGAGIIVLIAIAGLAGWVLNIVKLIGLLDGGVSAWLIARGIGVVAAPLGAVLGYF